MSSLPQEERIAVLLGALGRDLSETVLADLPHDARLRVRSLLDRFEEMPLDDAELEEVLQEFARFFRFAAQQLMSESSEGTGQSADGTAAAALEPVAAPVAQGSPTFTPSDDPFADLERLQPFQIVGALKDESPRTIGLVLNCLSPGRAGKTLQELPESIRSQVFNVLRNSSQAPAGLRERIVRTTVEKGCQLAMEVVADPQQERDRKLAALLREMGQRERGQMLAMLEEQDEECVARIRVLLYSFHDLQRISGRSIQRILADVDSSTLAIALKDAEESVVQKVLDNLSRRARATLTEELEFLTRVKPEEQQRARQEICTMIARLDQSGDLELV